MVSRATGSERFHDQEIDRDDVPVLKGEDANRRQEDQEDDGLDVSHRVHLGVESSIQFGSSAFLEVSLHHPEPFVDAARDE